VKAIILLVGHGSRGADGNHEIEEFARQWRARQPHLHIEVCFIEFAEVLLEEGLERAVQAATRASTERIIVVPLIINAAGHVKMEIPEYIAEARMRYPEVEFLYTRHLGTCEPILAILKRRLGQAMQELDVPDPKTTGIILLARGSSDPMANGQVAEMARWLFEFGDHESVDIAFTGITYPRLERVVQRQVRLGMMQMIILPYYLFTGRLIARIERQVANLREQYPRIRFACGKYFGFEEEIFQLVDQRVFEVEDVEGRMSCDGCKYREVAQG